MVSMLWCMVARVDVAIFLIFQYQGKQDLPKLVLRVVKPMPGSPVMHHLTNRK